jgi:hypothetical protein
MTVSVTLDQNMNPIIILNTAPHLSDQALARPNRCHTQL